MKKRFDIVDLIIISIIVCIITLITVNILLDNKNNDIVYISYKVKQGDNLATIADKHNKNTYILKAIATIKQDNNLKDSDLTVGQVLKIRGDM